MSGKKKREKSVPFVCFVGLAHYFGVDAVVLFAGEDGHARAVGGAAELADDLGDLLVRARAKVDLGDLADGGGWGGSGLWCFFGWCRRGASSLLKTRKN